MGQVLALVRWVGFLLRHFDKLLPLAVKWASEQEKWILRQGVALSAEELLAAKAVGIRQPEQVRLLRVDKIPSPRHPLLKIAQSAINLLTSAPRGLTVK